VGSLLVGLAIITVKVFDQWIIEEAAGKNRHAEFLRTAAAVSGVLSEEGLRNILVLERVVQNILELRPGIRWLDVFEIGPDGATLITSSRSMDHTDLLSLDTLKEIAAGRSVAAFDGASPERAWIITAPITLNGTVVVGAIRGRFSITKYDELILKQRQLAILAAIGAIIFTSSVFLILIRIQIHRPISQLLDTMEKVGSGNLSLRAPLTGPLEIQKLSQQFNHMLDKVRAAIATKESLIDEVRQLNATLEERVLSAVHQLRLTSEKLIQSQIQAERNEKLAAVGEMSAIIAHELGNPLNAISGRLQLMDDTSDVLQREKHLGIIRAQLDRMAAAIRHILDSTRLDLKSGPVSLNEVVQEVLSLVQTPRMTFNAHLAHDLPNVEVNNLSLHGLLLNLVTNALQAMPNGGVLTVTTLVTCDEALNGHVILRGPSAAHPMARLLVEDSGRGIPPDFLQRVSQPFFTTRHHEGGTGLGLAICRRVIASAGGRFAVKSDVGMGTTFTIDLPLWDESTI
jgi:signal transduction histidine kinase